MPASARGALHRGPGREGATPMGRTPLDTSAAAEFWDFLATQAHHPTTIPYRNIGKIMHVRRGQNRDRFKKNQGRAPPLSTRFWGTGPCFRLIAAAVPRLFGLLACAAAVPGRNSPFARARTRGHSLGRLDRHGWKEIHGRAAGRIARGANGWAENRGHRSRRRPRPTLLHQNCRLHLSEAGLSS